MGFKSPRAEMLTFKWLALNNLRSKAGMPFPAFVYHSWVCSYLRQRNRDREHRDRHPDHYLHAPQTYRFLKPGVILKIKMSNSEKSLQPYESIILGRHTHPK